MTTEYSYDHSQQQDYFQHRLFCSSAIGLSAYPIPLCRPCPIRLYFLLHGTSILRRSTLCLAISLLFLGLGLRGIHKLECSPYCRCQGQADNLAEHFWFERHKKCAQYLLVFEQPSVVRRVGDFLCDGLTVNGLRRGDGLRRSHHGSIHIAKKTMAAEDGDLLCFPQQIVESFTLPVLMRPKDNAALPVKATEPCFPVPDPLSFTYREWQTGGSPYRIPAGRRDGNVSVSSDAQANLPPPTANVAQLTQIFAKNELSQDQMVTLSGAHPIGVSHCSSFSSGLYNSSTSQDPALNAALASLLGQQCPPGSANTVPMDAGSPNTFDTSYFQNLLANRGLLTSDQTLTSDNATATLVAQNAYNLYLFVTKFQRRHGQELRMGSIIQVLTGRDGQIHTNCRLVN